MKFFHLINYNSLIICIFLLLSSLFLFSYLFKSKVLIIGSLLIFIFFAIFFTFNKITQHNSSKYNYVSNEIINNQNTLIYLYSNYWVACTAYKPFVKRLKNDISTHKIHFVEYDIATLQGKDFSNLYNYKSVPSMFLLNQDGNVIKQWNSLPELNQILIYIK